MTPQFLGAQLRATSGPFRALCLLLAGVFLFGGGSRGDIHSLAFLRPFAILLLFYGLACLTRAQIAVNRFVLCFALLSLLLLVLHLVPLPSQVWGALPGRELVREIDHAAGLGAVWRPFSLAPDATLNALYAALVPGAALVLGVQLGPQERRWLLWPVLLFGGSSVLLGIAQLSGPVGGPLYFYKVTNDGTAVGLFSNRNHQAFLLAALLPVLAVWATQMGSGSRGSALRALLAILAGAALLLLILVTGSRAGLVLGICALLSLPLVIPNFAARIMMRTDGAVGTRRWQVVAFAGLAAGLALLIVLTVARGRGLAWDRLIGSAAGSDLRFLIAPTVIDMIRQFLPFGSGMGSFERVFQVYETDAHLRPDYANHAHNDWLEVALTGGIPALILLVAALLAFALRGRILLARGLAEGTELQLARLGMVVVALLAIASLGDYPLRVPSLACFFVLGVLWMSCPLSKNRPSGQPS